MELLPRDVRGGYPLRQRGGEGEEKGVGSYRKHQETYLRESCQYTLEQFLTVDIDLDMLPVYLMPVWSYTQHCHFCLRPSAIISYPKTVNTTLKGNNPHTNTFSIS